ncbi:DUF4232 domain-containing protein [Streptomyces spongiae]|uniref:DUF4232 domain-containing protein n=1 Tax=Streptomyces spongiae TaxID=565072 RepID=A0A5N8XV05_9ACTN|nr:DUF4232 domain-containing protein [Streptomyces spongiae]MPY63204.1 DUF4232 domain-containing protein [Streptomyces spongiae]
MRTTPVALTAVLVAALTLTACGSDNDSGNDSDDTTKSSTSDKSTACKADQFGIEFGPSNAAPAAGDTGTVPVTLTNRDATCTLKGIPGTDAYAGGTSWAISPDKSAPAPTTTLAKDASATFTITYVRGVAGDAKKAADVDTVKFTLPGDKAVQSYKWPDAEVAVKSANELDMTVGPLVQAGD